MTVGVGLHQGSPVSHYLFAMIVDVFSGLRDKGSILLDRGACYMLVTLYCVAPEERRLNGN